jgi:hypothetical protein
VKEHKSFSGSDKIENQNAMRKILQWVLSTTGSLLQLSYAKRISEGSARRQKLQELYSYNRREQIQIYLNGYALCRETTVFAAYKRRKGVIFNEYKTKLRRIHPVIYSRLARQISMRSLFQRMPDALPTLSECRHIQRI